jgi:sodium-dependent dicarboxylate transporter 2/3/5
VFKSKPPLFHATMANTKTRSLLVLAPIVIGFVAFQLPAPDGLSPQGWRTAVLGMVMACFWMTEALPLAATAFIPIVAFPLSGVAKIDEVTQAYAHPLIFLFLGGFMLAAAMKRWELHSRIALFALRLAGPKPDHQVFALMAATAFLSLWISNTATAMVMMPIGLSIISAAQKNGRDAEGGVQHAPAAGSETRPDNAFGSALMLGIAYAATIGGMGSLIGTPPNALLAGFVAENYGESIGFGQWMLLGVPIVLVLLPITWLLLTRVFFSLPQPVPSATQERARLTPLSRSQRIVAAVLVLTACLWILRPLLPERLGVIGLSDAGIAIGASVILFMLPAHFSDGHALLTWEDLGALRWDVLILFGGGLALADAIRTSGLADWIGSGTSQLSDLPFAVLVLTMMVVVVYLGELASNTAMAAVFLPVAAAAAAGLGAPPLELILPVALAASLGFMLPVATPPNAIVYGSGAVTARQMLRAGAVLDVISIALVFIFALTLGPIVFRF